MKLFQKVLFTTASFMPALVSAAPPSQMLQVHVPFSFMVGAQEFAPGDYRVQQAESGIIFVQGAGKGAATLSFAGDSKPGTPTSLRFTTSQQRQYLVGVQLEGEPSRNIAMPAMEEQRKLLLTSAR